MDNQVTLIIIVRDRESARISRQVRSLRDHGASPEFLLVDYGSSASFSAEYEAIAAELDLKYEKLSTEGRPWCRSHALNRGARVASTKYVATSDVDMLYATNPLEVCQGIGDLKKMLHIETYWLPRNGDRAKAKYAGHGNAGGFQFIRREAYVEVGGYDERIKYWGLEELDWSERLKAIGYAQEWLTSPHVAYHQWHASAEGGGLRPQTASFNTIGYCAQNRCKPVLSQDWGLAVKASDRPILGLLATGAKFTKVELKTNALMHYGNLGQILDTRSKGGAVEINLQNRMIRRPLSKFADAAIAALRPLTALTGVDCGKKINRNFDFLYAMIPLLSDEGLMDYYFSQDLSTAYLLWN